jgi:hypothetical protein
MNPERFQETKKLYLLQQRDKRSSVAVAHASLTLDMRL